MATAKISVESQALWKNPFSFNVWLQSPTLACFFCSHQQLDSMHKKRGTPSDSLNHLQIYLPVPETAACISMLLLLSLSLSLFEHGLIKDSFFCSRSPSLEFSQPPAAAHSCIIVGGQWRIAHLSLTGKNYFKSIASLPSENK